MPVVQFEPRPRQPSKPPRKPVSTGLLVILGFVVIAVGAFVYFLVTGPN